MGASNSRPDTNVDSPEKEKTRLFSTIFVKLLKETDIVDLNALTKGPGACGSYVVLLEKELDKEFKQLKLQTTSSGESVVNTFLYTKTRDIETESPSDANACRELAIFYIRLIQLVGAITMSIYTPLDIIDRIRNRVQQQSIEKQQRNIPVSMEEIAARSEKRWKWFREYILSSTGSIPNLYNLKDKTNYKFNKENYTLSYTTTDRLRYDAYVSLYDMNKFNIDPSVKKSDSYWIILSKNKDGPYIFRILVNSDRSGYIFSPTAAPEGKEEKPILYYQDWTTDLGSTMSSSLTPVTPQSNRNKPRNYLNSTRRLNSNNHSLKLSRSTLAELAYAGVNVGSLTRHGGARALPLPASKNVFGYKQEYIISNAGPNPKYNAGPNPKSKNTPQKVSTLPKSFQEFYNFMLRWNSEINSWTEASPATYRSVLLYVKPGLSNLAATSYFCVDNWSQKKLRFIPPFAALESLYYNQNDGTASSENKDALERLSNAFKTIYSSPATAKTFDDVIVATIPEKIKNDFCRNKSSQGDIILSEIHAKILQNAQSKMLENYNKYFDEAYGILTTIFDVKTDSKGYLKIKFTSSFSNSSIGARDALENIISIARDKIANHYIDVENIYLKALQEINNAPRV
jgi:hypothetical protein